MRGGDLFKAGYLRGSLDFSSDYAYSLPTRKVFLRTADASIPHRHAIAGDNLAQIWQKDDDKDFLPHSCKRGLLCVTDHF